MTRQELEVYLTDTYGITGEYIFARYPNFQVFRHGGNRKWFAVLMDIPGKNLGLPGNGEISVVNLKCDTRLIGAFHMEPGIFPRLAHEQGPLAERCAGWIGGRGKTPLFGGYEL